MDRTIDQDHRELMTLKDHRHYLTLSIKTGWQKLNEYYTKLGDSPLFAASIIFHATLGMNYLEVTWASKE
jgi:hypothetical protein